MKYTYYLPFLSLIADTAIMNKLKKLLKRGLMCHIFTFGGGEAPL